VAVCTTLTFDNCPSPTLAVFVVGDNIVLVVTAPVFDVIDTNAPVVVGPTVAACEASDTIVTVVIASLLDVIDKVGPIVAYLVLHLLYLFLMILLFLLLSLRDWMSLIRLN